MELKGKVAIVTGGARGMGEAHVRMLTSLGAKVLFTDLLEEEGQKLAAELGEQVTFVKHDVSKVDAWAEVVQLAEEKYGALHILVNNAGISIKKSIEELTEEEYRKVIDVNQISVFLGMKAVLPAMRRAKGGSIINISSILGMAAREDILGYVSSKFAIRGMTKTAALEFAKDGIRVNSVHPGSIRTALTDLVYKTEEEQQQREASIPLQRFGHVDDVANIVAFLASDRSSYCTGSEFLIDGGVMSRI